MASPLQSRSFGTLPTGEPVEAWTLTGAGGLVLEAITYGGIVTRLLAPGRRGRLADVVLGYAELASYVDDRCYFGAIVGRVAGRITNARFELDGEVYRLEANDAPNHLHGGTGGFSGRLWAATPVERADGAPSLRLARRSADGEEGYPGNVDVAVTYTVTADNRFLIETEAATDRPTPFALTHHSYFNLAGENAGTIAGHELQIEANEYVPTDERMTLLGKLAPVASGLNDFREPRRLGDAVPSLFQHHGDLYRLREVSDRVQGITPARAARLVHEESGRVLEVATTAPYMQLYTGAALDGSIAGKSGAAYPRHAGVCLECQEYADGANTPALGDITLRPGQPRRQVTTYGFSSLAASQGSSLEDRKHTELRYAPAIPDRKDFRIGILGSGFIVDECHLVSYRRAGFNPVGIASRSRDNAVRAAARHSLARIYDSYDQLLDDPAIEVLDIAVPPQHQLELIRGACARRTVKGILAQKPLALNYADAERAVALCEDAGIVLAVNQNMRYDPTVHAANSLLREGFFGEPVFATIDMRGVPHWQPWQAATGSATLKVMSIHHLDCMRHWFGDPERVFCSGRPDPRTAFAHHDGICTTILEYAGGLRCVIVDDVWTGPAKEGCPADIRIEWRIEGLDGLAIGDLGWCKDPYTTPSTMRYARKGDAGFQRFAPKESWFPDAFAGTMGELLIAIESGVAPAIGGRGNLKTIALVEAAALSIVEHRVVRPREIAEMHVAAQTLTTAGVFAQ
jgi:galactose mutarotase-like enzyme/predicted dehydrogenase